MNTIAVYPGSFDPVTNGHIDIISRAVKMFDIVVVALCEAHDKKQYTFSIGERKMFLEKAMENIDGRAYIRPFSGLIVDLAKDLSRVGGANYYMDEYLVFSPKPGMSIGLNSRGEVVPLALDKRVVLIRGIRATTDFEYEFQMAGANKLLAPEIETLFLPTSESFGYISSSLVREVAKNGGDISKFVPACLVDKIVEKFRSS